MLAITTTYVCACRLRRAATVVPSTRQPTDKTADRRWYSAPLGGASGASVSSDSCVSAVELATTTAAPVDSDESMVVRRRVTDETLLDLTTPATSRCPSPKDKVTPPATPRQSLSRRASDTLADASRPGSAHHPVLPPIRQLRSDHAVVTVGAAAADD